MKKELILSLPGFMLCILPALDEQNSKLKTKVEEILKETEEIVGTSEFYGEIWKAMLRTPRSRLSAIRYLKERIPINKQYVTRHAVMDSDEDYYSDSDEPDEEAKQDRRDLTIQLSKSIAQQEPANYHVHLSDYQLQIKEGEVIYYKNEEKFRKEQERSKLIHEDLENYFYFYFPNKSQVVINAIITGLSNEESKLVNRATLDFLVSHMPLNSEINSIKENIRLTEHAIQLYTQRGLGDFAVLAKITNWLFEHIEEDEIDDKDMSIISIVGSLKNMFKR